MTAVVLFTRDLRVQDNPALAEAVRGGRAVAPLAVVDDAILEHRFASPNRVAFFLDALDDLRESLRRRGGDLIVRRGDPVGEAIAVASAVWKAWLAAPRRALAPAPRRISLPNGVEPGDLPNLGFVEHAHAGIPP